MDQGHHLPYFPPPPGRPDEQHAPLPQRQTYEVSPYDYHRTLAEQSSHPSFPVPAALQTWGLPPALPKLVPLPNEQPIHNLPPLPARPSSLRGLFSNIKSVAQVVHNEARFLASTFVQQQEKNKYGPRTSTTQSSPYTSSFNIPPNTTHQHASQTQISYPQFEYWNHQPTAPISVSQGISSAEPIQHSYNVLGQTSEQVYFNAPGTSNYQCSTTPIQSMYSPEEAVISSQGQQTATQPVPVNYQYPHSEVILHGQTGGGSVVPPRVNCNEINKGSYASLSNYEQASYTETPTYIYPPTQHARPNVADSPSVQSPSNIAYTPQYQQVSTASSMVSGQSSEITEEKMPNLPFKLAPSQQQYNPTNAVSNSAGYDIMCIPPDSIKEHISTNTEAPNIQVSGSNVSLSGYPCSSYIEEETRNSGLGTSQALSNDYTPEVGQFNAKPIQSNIGTEHEDQSLGKPLLLSQQLPTLSGHQQDISPSNCQAETADQPHQTASVGRDQIDNMVDELKKFSLGGSTNITDPTPHPIVNEKWIEDDWPRPPLIISDHGEPNEVIWDCPGNIRDTVYETLWFRLPTVPDFLICSRCHSRFLQDTALATSFEKIRRSNGRCRFNVPRITSVLLPQCFQTKSVEPLEDYMLKRLSIQDCKAQAGVKGKDNYKWVIINGDTNDIMINFMSCEACYEDVIQASAYAGEFIPRESRYPNPQPQQDTWKCDLSFPYVRRSFIIFSKNNAPFSSWVEKATKRFQLPQCEGKTVESCSRQWVTSRDKVEGLVICENCYFDQIAWTAIENDFEYVPVEKTVTGSEWMDHALGYRQKEPSAWTCDARLPAIVSALDAAVKRQDAKIFSKYAGKILSSPPCVVEGISNGTWYTLKGGCNNYNVCQSCFIGFCEAFDSGRFFEKSPTTGTADTIRCNMHGSSPRFLQFTLSLFEAQQEGVWSRFSDTVQNYIGLPECPRETHVPGRKWYGWHDCLICPECYKEICEKTRGNLKFEIENEVIEDIRMCCLYSPRMREKWVTACEHNDATELLEFSLLRHGVYSRTVPQIKMLRQMQEMQMMSAMSAGFAGLMYQGAQSIQAVSGATDGYLHGNSSVGWHETENGVVSAEKFNEMNLGFNQANSGNSWMQIFQLSLEWQKVE